LAFTFTTWTWRAVESDTLANHTRPLARARNSGARRLLLPVGTSNHWLLHVIDLDSRCVVSYDSMCERNGGVLILRTWELIRTRLLDSVFPDPAGRAWRHVVRPSPQQPNGFDCGPYVLWNATHIVQGRTPATPPGEFRTVILKAVASYLLPLG
jgi:hypothetical protein